MGTKKYNKIILLSLKILLFIAGFSVGIMIVWQIFEQYPDAAGDALKVVFYIVSGIVPAVILFLSAKPLYFLLHGAGTKIISKLQGVKGENAAGVILCLVLGLILGYLCDIVLSLFISILALRIVIDFFIGLFVMYGALVMFYKLINASAKERADEDNEDVPFGGYIFTKKALENEKTIFLIEKWLSGNMYILNSAVISLLESEDERGKETYENIISLKEKKLLTPCLEGETGQENELIMKFAAKNNLKIITLNEEESKNYDDFEGVVLIVGQV